MASLDTPNSLRNWVFLLVVTAALTGAFYALRLPAVFLLGPMLSGLILASRGLDFSLPKPLVAFCQGIIGVMIAGAMPITVFAEIAKDGLLFMAIVLSVVVVSYGIGWLLAKYQVLPGTTAIWGSSPGAASAMVLLAESAGADFRLVAFMQYLRMLIVAATASLIARFALGQSGAAAPPEPWFAPFDWTNLALTMLVAASGPIVSRFLQRPSINMLLPIGLGIALHSAGLVTITLPMWLLAAAYTLFGWNVGFRFTRDIVIHALRALPVLCLTSLSLIALCGGIAVAVSHFGHIDLLTAYLATSPGGADSVAIIAASSPVDKPFVLAMQMARFITVLFLGPLLARFAAAQFDRRQPR